MSGPVYQPASGRGNFEDVNLNDLLSQLNDGLEDVNHNGTFLFPEKHENSGQAPGTPFHNHGNSSKGDQHLPTSHLTGNEHEGQTYHIKPLYHDADDQSIGRGCHSIQHNGSLVDQHEARHPLTDDYAESLHLARLAMQDSPGIDHHSHAQDQNFQATGLGPSITSRNFISPMGDTNVSSWSGGYSTQNMALGRPTPVPSTPDTFNDISHSFPARSVSDYNAGVFHNHCPTKQNIQGMSSPEIITHPQYSKTLHPWAMGSDQSGDYDYSTSRRREFLEYKSPSIPSPTPIPYPRPFGTFSSNIGQYYPSRPDEQHSNQPTHFNVDHRFAMQPCPSPQFPHRLPGFRPKSTRLSEDIRSSFDESGRSTQAVTANHRSSAVRALVANSDIQSHFDDNTNHNIRNYSSDAIPPGPQGRKPRICVDCKSNISKNAPPRQNRCKRHWEAYIKSLVGPPSYSMDDGVLDEDTALEEVFPRAQALDIRDDDWRDQQEDDWVKCFLDAINTPYPHPSRQDVQKQVDHIWLQDQQNEFNRKPKQHTSITRGSYTNRAVTARVRLLYMCAINYHRGGQIPYPIGGDNWGYEEDRNMKCSHRLQRIAEYLSTDKRIAMNVIEGRGVYAFAKNPENYAGRKATNSRSNTKKKELIIKGKAELLAAESRSAPRLAPDADAHDRRPRKRVKLSEEQSLDLTGNTECGLLDL